METVRLIVQRRDFDFVGDLRAELVCMPACGASGGVSASWLALTFDGYERQPLPIRELRPSEP